MLEANGFSPQVAWRFGAPTVAPILLAACRESDGCPQVNGSVAALLSVDTCRGVRDPVAVGCLQDRAEAHAQGLRDWLVAQRTMEEASSDMAPLRVGSRSSLQSRGGPATLLPAIVDMSASKTWASACQGQIFPSSARAALASSGPHNGILFVPDLLTEVRRTFPEVEDSGGKWVDAEAFRGG